jgi:hypothetical protein
MLLIPVPPVQEMESSAWLVGRYKDQTTFATDLRHSGPLQRFVTENRIRLGLRSTDLPPFNVERQERYGGTVAGANAPHVEERLRTLARPIRRGTPPDNRLSDQKENVRRFWETQTPQSHHIVEFNHLRDIGVSGEDGFGAMDHGQLPCVLLAAEFHQRYFSSLLKQTHGWNQTQLRDGLNQIYSSLYLSNGLLFQPLWSISKIILVAAGISR